MSMIVPGAINPGFMGSSEFYPYKIDQSIRFNLAESARLSRTVTVPGNQRKWTWSAWIKRSGITVRSQLLFSEYIDSSNRCYISCASTDKIGIVDEHAGVIRMNVESAASRLFRDITAWQHWIVVVDTAQATAADRIKFYVNGVQEVLTGTFPAQNTALRINTTLPHYVGSGLSDFYFDGYMAEIQFVDGQALAPTSFGQFKQGVWIPKKYTGTYGTNGFYLKPASGFTLGDDHSGNENDFTWSGINGADRMTDSPTNNFCTLNPIGAPSALSDGNLRATRTGMSAVGTFGMTNGKWYWEVTVVGAGSQDVPVGISNNPYSPLINASGGYGWGFRLGRKWENGSLTIPGGTAVAGDVISLAFDADAGTLDIKKNNAAVFQITGILPGTYFPAASSGGTAGTDTLVSNFGQSAFAYTPPTGFKALCSKNLAKPLNAVMPGEKGFDTLLYTGAGADQSVAGLSFKPDLVWIKQRDAIKSNYLWDSVRGVTKRLITNDVAVEADGGIGVSSFNNDGFSLVHNNAWSAAGGAFTAWCWRKGPAYGFDIVTYTGNGVAGRTVAHSLGRKPAFIILKRRDTSSSWVVYHGSRLGEYSVLSTNSFTTTDAALVWGNDITTVEPTASAFTVGTGGGVNAAGGSYVAYLWSEIPGFSKFGSYTGNGSADGPFVYTGFRPAFVMVKRADAASTTYGWYMQDSTRNPVNPVNKALIADNTREEAVLDVMDFLSNGFKIRNNGTNINGGTCVYIAFAEHPEKYSNAR